MAATTLPADLRAAREQFLAITGLSGIDIGALPDPRHKSGGGYHCGCQDIIDIGKWATAGSPKADYSVRLSRDRVGANACSAIDVGDNWPKGGRSAWIRWNNALVAEMRAGNPDLAALRAVNFTPDGTSRKRYDSQHPSAGIIPSTDTVDGHTHLEWYRDTVGTAGRKRSIDRIAALMQAAIRNQPISGGGTVTTWDTAFTPPEESSAITLNVAAQIVYNSLLHGGMDNDYTARTFPNSIFARVRRLEVKADQVLVQNAQILAKLDQLLEMGGIVPSPPPDIVIGEDVILDALESDRGQAALTKAANEAEDS